jgi:hypothetical protein
MPRRLQRIWPILNARMSRRGTVFFISTLFFVLLTVLLLLLDPEPPQQPLSVQGIVTDRTPIETKGKLTGFRFCVGNPKMTFTYLNPDPNVERAWAALQGATRVRVQYAVHERRNPTLWSLEADGRFIATMAELEEARSSRFWLLLVGVCLTFAIAVAAATSWFTARRAR